jgi:hypothetical protein
MPAYIRFDSLGANVGPFTSEYFCAGLRRLDSKTDGPMVKDPTSKSTISPVLSSCAIIM